MSENENKWSTQFHLNVVELHNKVGREVANVLQHEIAIYPSPVEVQKFLEQTIELHKHVNMNKPVGEIPIELLPWLKRAILDARLDLANQLEVSRARVSDPQTIKELDKQLAPYEELMSQDWFKRTEAVRMPRLADFLTVERVEFHLRNEKQQQRQYDDKFHILQASTLFLPDLGYYRKKCAIRNLPLVAAFMDIDNFKSFNNEHGETYIDLYLLPRFMAALEAHVYVRGFAYRFGGDEYAVLLPNTDTKMGAEILADLQRRLEKIQYQGIKQNPTVSIGFCEIRSDCHFTNRELLNLSEKAKNFAKREGRNCMATYSDSLFTIVTKIG